MDMREALTAAFDEETKDAETQTPIDDQGGVVEVTEGEGHSPDNSTENESDGAVIQADEKEDSAGKKASVQAIPVATKAPETVPGTTHRVDRAPASWKKEAKGEWAALPLQARQEIHRREMEVQRVLNENAPIRKEMEEFRGTVAPFMARIQSLGVTPNQAVGHLLRADYALATGTPQQKAAFIDKLLQDYNVDIAELDSTISRRLGGQPQPQPQGFDPNQISQLVQQQLQQALAPIYQQRQQQEQQVQQQATQTVEQMSLDPKYPHFDAVREDMADLMELNSRRGIYISIEQAYNRAVSMNPELSAMTQATQLHSRAQRAAAAGVSVSGTPVGGGQQVHVTTGNLRDDIEAAFGGAANRV